MNSLEKTFWALIKSHLPKGAVCHHQRIETGSTGKGIADVNICYQGVETWLELKVVDGKRVKVEPEQASWNYKRWRAGGRNFFVARDKADGVRKGKYDRIYVWDGNKGPELIDHGINTQGATVYESPFDWDIIIEYLLARK